MKFSIITPTLNSEKTILCNLNAVQSQSSVNVEHIIIDNSSSDDTLRTIHKNANSQVVLLSEKDSGIYDALNKGIKMATGDIIGILNSDDVYANNHVLKRVQNIFANHNVDSIYGDLVFFDPLNKKQITRYWKSEKFVRKKFFSGWSPPHPTFFVRRSVIEKFGVYKPEFKISGDYEFMLRLLFKEKISTYYIPEVLVKMQVGGISNKNFNNRFKANLEDRKAWKVNKLNPKWYTLFLKPLRKIQQYKLVGKSKIEDSNFNPLVVDVLNIKKK